jgi:hypothetical protein
MLRGCYHAARAFVKAIAAGRIGANAPAPSASVSRIASREIAQYRREKKAARRCESTAKALI